MKTLFMAFCAMAGVVTGQGSVLQGTVVNQYGTVVPSARLEWKQNGATTGLDTNGLFRLPLSDIIADELHVAAYGYIDTVLPRASVQSPLSITLYPVAGKVRLTGAAIPKGMKPVTGGTFQMSGQSGTSNPVRTVRVSSFWMDSTETTVADFYALMDRYPWYKESKPFIDSSNGMPMHSVSWSEAVLYCNARSKLDGLDTVYTYTSILVSKTDIVSASQLKVELEGVFTHFDRNGYRLPTEAEWEYASRGLTSTCFFWGNSTNPQEVSKYAVTAGSSQNIRPVASRMPNVFGLYDMIGNVRERTNDMAGPWPDSVQVDPTGSSAGISNIYRDVYISCHSRHASNAPYRDYMIGFRAVLRDTQRIPWLPDPHTAIIPPVPELHRCSFGEAGNPVTFFQSRLALCTKSHSVAFRYVWDDGDTSSWFDGALHQHVFRDSGSYRVKVQARCRVDTTIVSGFSNTSLIKVSGPHFITPVPVVSGPIKGKVGVSQSFDAVPVLCNQGHRIRYFFDWNDGFASISSMPKGIHCYVHGGRYAISVFAECAYGGRPQVCSDTSHMTITVEDTSIVPTSGYYRSGMIYEKSSPLAWKINLDFSDSVAKQSDLMVIGYNYASPRSEKLRFYVPHGAYYHGSILLPKFDVRDRNIKPVIDSIVSRMQIVAPGSGFQCCTTDVEWEIHPACTTSASKETCPVMVVKTAEGHYGLFITVDFWVGANVHYLHYWGYQSDGSRFFNPDVKSVAIARGQGELPQARLGISAVFTGKKILLSLPGSNPTGVISLYTMKGCLAKRVRVARSQKVSIDLQDLPIATYVLQVNSGKHNYVGRFFRAP